MAELLLYSSSMEALVAKILEASKQSNSLTARQMFFQEFDRLLVEPTTQESLVRFERYGRDAGISEVEMNQRKSVLAWNLAKAA